MKSFEKKNCSTTLFNENRLRRSTGAKRMTASPFIIIFEIPRHLKQHNFRVHRSNSYLFYDKKRFVNLTSCYKNISLKKI